MCNLLGGMAQLLPGVLLQTSLFAAWGSVWPYLVMILGFSVIVFVHELGHFAVAKWAGVRVDRFAIGFGRELFGFTRGETRYSFNILPLGGYVKMLGQEDFDDKSQELQFKDDPRSFINKPVSHRMAIVSAGVVMNVFFACLLFMIVFMIGLEAPGTRIGFVEPDSPADKAGLLPGDDIKRINGDKIVEFRDVSMAIQLAPPHEPIEFIVERDGEAFKPILVKPDYRRPENSREARRQVIGIAPGLTREIVRVGPGIDSGAPDQPRVGDRIVEIDGIGVTDANANVMWELLASAKEVFVERSDAANPAASPQRIRVHIDPQLGIYPADVRDADSISVLGLTPLMRISYPFNPEGRAELAGLEVGDTILTWDDVAYPTRAVIARAIIDNAETDIPFKVQKADGRVLAGFVRPERNPLGSATIQARVEPIPGRERTEDGPQARFSQVRRFGRAERAGIQPGDVIRRINEVENPSAAVVQREIRALADAKITLVVQKSEGRSIMTIVRPQAAGSIDAGYVIADDVLRTGAIVEMINDQPSPAAEAGIPAGARITSVNQRPVARWRDLIESFEEHAGATVDLEYHPNGGEAKVVAVRVPHCLRTLLGVGPEARILSIDGKKSVVARTGRGDEEVHVGYHEGTRAALMERIGQRDVPIVYRPTAFAAPVTKHIDVTVEMVDPWLGRIVYAPNIDVAGEFKLIRGANALEAVRIGLHKTYYFIVQVYEVMNRMIFSQSVGVENLSGPLGIVSIGGQIARVGPVEFLFFMAIISANLAVINFLPLPIVDGGLMVFLLIEKIKGSPVSLRVQVATQVIGLFLIIGAFLFVTYNDVVRIWG